MACRRIYVGNVCAAPDCTNAISELLRAVGPLASPLALERDPHGVGAHRGFGYAVFMDSASAARAVASLDGRMVEGRALRIVAAPGDADGSGAGRPVALVPSVAAAVDGMSPAELWAVASEVKALVEDGSSGEAQVRGLLARFPMLAHALLRVEERLGMLQAQVPPSLASGVAAATAHVTAARQRQQPVPEPPLPSAHRDPPRSDVEEQVAVLRGILSLTDEDVAQMDADQARDVVLVRRAAGLNAGALAALPPDQREELLVMRGQLQAFGIETA